MLEAYRLHANGYVMKPVDAAAIREDMLIRKSGVLAIRPERIDCDYYRMLSGNLSGLNAYHGEYMTQYSWAEMTSGKLWFDYSAQK